MQTMLMAGVVLMAATVGADEKKVQEAEVPKPVLEAVAHKYPRARRVGYEKEIEKGRTTFEVKVVDGSRRIDVDLSIDGKILAEEEVITMGDTPDAVRRALATSEKYGKWTVRRVERVVKDEKTDAPEFEIGLFSGAQRAEVTFAADGRVLSTE